MNDAPVPRGPNVNSVGEEGRFSRVGGFDTIVAHPVSGLFSGFFLLVGAMVS